MRKRLRVLERKARIIRGVGVPVRRQCSDNRAFSGCEELGDTHLSLEELTPEFMFF